LSAGKQWQVAIDVVVGRSSQSNKERAMRNAGRSGLVLVVSVVMFAALADVRADQLTWDNGGANMQWDTSTANWTGDTWDNGAPDDATFGAAGAGTVTLTEPITAGNITIGVNNQDYGYTITSATAADTLTVNGQLTAKEKNGLNIYSDIILTNSGELACQYNAASSLHLYGDLYLNNDGVTIDPSHGNRIITIRGDLNGTASSVNVGRGTTRIHATATVNYGGKFRLYRSGAGDTTLEIGEGINLANNITIANSHLGNFRRLGLIDGSTHGTFSGDISISGSNKDGVDDGFQIHADAGETITVSGEIVTGSSQDEGVDINGGGTVLLTGDSAYNEPTTVRNVTLGGDGTIADTASINGTAIHSPGVDNVGVQTFSNLNYAAGSKVIWQLGTNSEDNRGADYAAIDVNGDLDFDATTTLELVFTNGASAVDWNDGFWRSSHEWLLWDVAGTTTDFSALSLTTNTWEDANGAAFTNVITDSTFSIGQTGNDIYLNYTAPPMGTMVSIR